MITVRQSFFPLESLYFKLYIEYVYAVFSNIYPAGLPSYDDFDVHDVQAYHLGLYCRCLKEEEVHQVAEVVEEGVVARNVMGEQLVAQAEEVYSSLADVLMQNLLHSWLGYNVDDGKVEGAVHAHPQTKVEWEAGYLCCRQH